MSSTEIRQEVVKTVEVEVSLTISVKQGILTVEGPIADKMLCAHMIADAFKFIMDQKGRPAIIKAGGLSVAPH